MGTMTVIPANDRMPIEQRTNLLEYPTLDQIRTALRGGWAERLGYFTTYEEQRAHAYADEEGMIKELPPNQRAFDLWRTQCPFRPKMLVGDVVIISGTQRFLEQV